MPAQIYRYTPVVEAGPNGRTLFAKLPEGALVLCALGDLTYITVPEGVTIPDQHPEITLELVVVDYGLRELLKKNSRAVQLIDQSVIDRIRSAYSLDDEQYFARIGVGVALGAYTFEPGEQESLVAFGAYVEECRQWGRAQRTALGV